MSEREIWKPDVTVAAIVEQEGRFLFIEERVRGTSTATVQFWGVLRPRRVLQGRA